MLYKLLRISLNEYGYIIIVSEPYSLNALSYLITVENAILGKTIKLNLKGESIAIILPQGISKL